MRNTIIAGNWKLNGDLSLCEQFAAIAQAQGNAQSDVTTLICPPAIWLGALVERLSSTNWKLGGQNLASEISGAYTGEISASMLRSVGASYCIVGHSERRELFGESNAIVAKKAALALDAGLTPIVCVGEDLACREAGNENDFVASQLLASIDGLDAASAEKVVIAYEPVWAIGTGVTASSEQAQSMHAHIRKVLSASANSDKIPLLYGGSVKAENAGELLAQPDIDGALVGGASLKVNEFLAIVEAARLRKD